MRIPHLPGEWCLFWKSLKISGFSGSLRNQWFSHFPSMHSANNPMKPRYGIDTSILVDRLIVNDYHTHGLVTLTRDRKMGSLAEAVRL